MPYNGGYQLNSQQAVSFSVPKDFMHARAWARTNCNSNSGRFSCDTGDCGPSVQCGGKWGLRGVSLAEWAFSQWNGLDFYDISLVDGFNVPISMQPTSASGTSKSCGLAACKASINFCPSELRVVKNGQVVECLNVCPKFGTDQYCCIGAYGNENACKPQSWPVNYAAKFKNACPDAYSYPFDDPTSIFTCKNTNYIIRFC